MRRFRASAESWSAFLASTVPISFELTHGTVELEFGLDPKRILLSDKDGNPPFSECGRPASPEHQALA
jgi:hypothetical protein